MRMQKFILVSSVALLVALASLIVAHAEGIRFLL